jgi:hypothetical protein
MKIPCSSRKRYLGGADWCVAALNQGTIEATGRPSSFHVAVFFEGIPDPDRVETGFRAYCGRFPVLWGAPARCWCLAPYWRHPPTTEGLRVSVARDPLPAVTREDVLRRVESLANDPRALKECRVALHLLRTDAADGVWVFSFDHHLFDAGGAESFIDLFCRFLDGTATESEFPDPHPVAPAQLDRWRARYDRGRQLNREILRLTGNGTTELPLPADARARPFRFRVATFDEAESVRIRERAFSAAGYLMFMPYVLATASAVFRPFFAKRAAPESHFVVTVSTNKPGEGKGGAPHLFFNDLSFLYFSFPLSAAEDRDALARTASSQLIDQVRQGMPEAIEDSNRLMRILSPRGFWKFMTLFFRSRLSSFALTCLGDPAIQVPGALGCRIRTHLHLPVIPTPPGLGLILNRSGGVYHAVLSTIEGILPEDEIDAILPAFRAMLLGEDGTPVEAP